MLRSGTFECQRFDCPRIKNEKLKEMECPKCFMPDVGPGEKSILTLFQRCKEWNQLPCKGSILDQPESVMRVFDVISNKINEYRAEKDQEAEANLNRERMKHA